MTGNDKVTFALFFGNRGFFPASLMEAARKELTETLAKLGYEYIILDAEATRYGAVETPEEGKIYARFLEENKGRYDGIILSLPNFGDETGAVEALKHAGVPIFIQAYPDELDKMSPDKRRDAFCGKFSIMDVFKQYDIPFTVYKPHTVSPGSGKFAENLDNFARVCRVVGGMKELTVGAIGARTTPFKTVRIDELTLQKYGITMETFDLSEVFSRMRGLNDTNVELQEKREILSNYASWQGVPEVNFDNIARYGVVLDQMIGEHNLDAVAVRCWIELQQEFGISPCVVLSEMNNRKKTAACEVDIGSAVTMHALSLASGDAATCLDWNNNYGDEEDKCILFHCGPVPAKLMKEKGRVVDHEILKNSVGPGCSYGPSVGRIRPFDFTYGNLLSVDGRLEFYLGEAAFTDDPVPEDFFGCAGVAEFADLQNTLMSIGCLGHRHHVALTPGNVLFPVYEAFVNYLGYNVDIV
jgi:L-fucose isomerase-like protein